MGKAEKSTNNNSDSKQPQRGPLKCYGFSMGRTTHFVLDGWRKWEEKGTLHWNGSVWAWKGFSSPSLLILHVPCLIQHADGKLWIRKSSGMKPSQWANGCQWKVVFVFLFVFFSLFATVILISCPGDHFSSLTDGLTPSVHCIVCVSFETWIVQHVALLLTASSPMFSKM